MPSTICSRSSKVVSNLPLRAEIQPIKKNVGPWFPMAAHELIRFFIVAVAFPVRGGVVALIPSFFCLLLPLKLPGEEGRHAVLPPAPGPDRRAQVRP